MNLRQRVGFTIVGGQHVLVVGVPDAAGRDVGKDILAPENGNGFSVVDETAADGVSASGDMSIFDDGIGRHDRLFGDITHLNRDLVDRRQVRRGVVRLEQLVSLALRVAVVGSLANDVDRLPGVEAN